MCSVARKFALPVVAPIALAALITCPLIAQSAPSSSSPAAPAGNHSRPAGNHPEMRMSHDALRIFNDVDMAAKALAQNNKTAAQHDLMMAMNARDRLAMVAKNNNLPKIVPIFSELDQDTSLGTILAAKNNGNANASPKQPVTIDDVKDNFTFVGIDLDKTKARLQAANEAIQNNNLQAAEQSLSSIGDDLVVAKVSSDTPLLAIRENLGLAHIAASSSHPHEATAALQEASGELSAYIQNSGNAHQQQAQQLKSSIDAMLGKSGQKMDSSTAQIGKWWAEVNSWMQTPSA